MEKKKWLWKRRSSESESSGSLSFSSPSERYSDEQDVSRESPNGCIQSPEITSKLSFTDDEMKDSVKRLTEKLSAALVNVSAKEDLVKQHAKVAEEAVAGWEKAENEVAALKQQNSNLEARVSHLDGALKECVRQLRQGRDEQDKRIAEAIEEREKEWESVKAELEKQIRSSSTDPKSLLVESVEKENSSLKHELKSRSKELESVTIERDLSIQAAEAASKLQLESIKKVAKLEAECRKLQSLARKSTSANSLKPAATSLFYAESLTDSHSDSNVDNNGSEPSCSDSWASALIAELDQFKNEKLSLTACSVEINMMDDFLEMERIAALPDTKSNTNTPFSSSSRESISMESNPLRGELESMIQRVAELEKKLEKMEGEKAKLENALHESEISLKAAHDRMAEGEAKMEELQKEKELLESQLIGMEVESRTVSANVDMLNAEVKKEQALSAKLSAKCDELESGLIRSVDESLSKQNTSNPNGEVKIKQEDLAVAADKLAECQRTIASLGRQLQSLATLEDFLIDTSNIPGFSSKVCSNDEKLNDGNGSTATKERRSNVDESSVTSSANQVVAPKSKNGFGKFFSRSKSGVELSNRQD